MEKNKQQTHEVKHLPTADIIMGGTEEECEQYINGVLPAGDYIVQETSPSPATLEGEQFTSGEWQIYKSDDFKRPYSIIIPHSLKTLNGSKPKTVAISIENKEDVYLIAASKNMFKALKLMIRDFGEQSTSNMAERKESLRIAAEAILKASPNTLNK